MSNRKLSGKALVVQITREEIRIARMALGAAMPQILESAVLPTPEGAVEDGELRNLDALRAVMEPVLREKTFRRCRRVVFAMCSTQVITESVTVPVVNRRQRLGQMLEANMDMYFPVAPQEYHLTWQVVGKEKVDGAEQLRVQLWAVPRQLLDRYYALANSMGLAVAAVDFCGHSHVSAVDISFGVSGGKQEKNVAKEDGDGAAPGTDLYINAENELLLMTFAQNGQVKMQRFMQRGFSIQDDLSEAGMALDYYTSTTGASELQNVQISGGRAGDDALLEGLSDVLGVPARPLSCQSGPEWLMCQGASKTDLDFGDPEMNHLTGAARPINRAWQYGLIFLGGAALTASVMLLLTSSLTWDIQLNSLRSTKEQLLVMAQKNAGSGQRYEEYSSQYDRYSADWDTMFDSLRTYNDNLVLMLGELERVLPKAAAVTELSTADKAMAVQVAFQDKMDAAYFLMALREVPYADIAEVSRLRIGQPTKNEPDTPDKMLAALYEAAGQESPVPDSADPQGYQLPEGLQDSANVLPEEEALETPPTEGGYSLSGLLPGTEAPPTEGDNNALSAEELQTYLLLMQMMQGGGNSSSTDMNTLLLLSLLAGGSAGQGTSGENAASVDTSAITAAMQVLELSENDLRLRLQYLDGDQLDILQQTYGKKVENTFDMAVLAKQASMIQRKTALRTLLNGDRSAMYKFFLLLQEDIEREAGKRILYDLIHDDVWKNVDMYRMLYESDQKMLDKYLPDLIAILTKSTENLTAAERLIRTDQALTDKWTIHLAAAMRKTNEKKTALDVKSLKKDIDEGKVFDRDARAAAAVVAMMPEEVQELYRKAFPEVSDSGDSMADILELIKLLDAMGLKDTDDIFNSGTSTSGSGGQVQAAVDNRYYMTVVLSYDESMSQAELIRKGLDRGDKVRKVEVAQ